ncbi:NADH-quinone oxidoreductase subunit NuoE [bacterium]|nr:NADH-quinone oxidoreductase subunit NuoE [candidate division CSSED10-310 bacterium]
MREKTILEMQKNHTVLNEQSFEPVILQRGYANRTLHIDLSKRSIEIRPVTERMKELWTGGKGFDLWLMFQEIDANTRWDSPENPLCMSSGPLGGVASFPGSGKTIVTSISPATESIMDSNVGGYFGPYLKFAGFDALVITGKSDTDVSVFIDATHGRISIEKTPDEAFDAHVVCEQFTEMYADSEDDKRNIAVVAAGSAADHVWIGVLNFSFYDWRRKVTRVKQAGRGGMGTVFRDKKLKALVIKNQDFTPAWTIVDQPFVDEFRIQPAATWKPLDPAEIEAIAAKWSNDPEYVIEMMQDIQDRERYISREAIDELNRITGVPKSRLYHIATFYGAFTLRPVGECVIQVCVGTACHVKGAARIIETFERELGISRGHTTEDGRFTLEAVACLGCCSLAPVVKINDEIIGNVKVSDVAGIIRKQRGEGR